MKLKTLLIFPIVLIILFGGIAVADGIGLWKTESSKVPSLIKTGEFEGTSNPEDIKGSYSFQDIENAFNVPTAIIAEAFGINSDYPGDILAKDLEGIYGVSQEGLEVGTGSVRTFIAYYIGLDYEGDDGIPKQAVDILRDQGKWSKELDDLYEGRIIDLSQFESNQLEENQGEEVLSSEKDLENQLEEDLPSEKVLEDEHDEDEQEVNGKTTVAELISWGISLEEVEEILTVQVDNENMLVKDICTKYDLSFNDVKLSINELLE